MQDDFLQFGQSNIEEFAAVTNVREYDYYYNSSAGYIAAVYIRYDHSYDIYQRRSYSILVMLGDIGGF